MGELERNRRPEITTGERLTSRVRGHTLPALSEASRELFGDDGHRALLDRLPSPIHAKLQSPPEWVSLELVIAWIEAAWEGPLRQDHAQLARLVDRTLDLGFGRVRRLLLTIATPHGVVRRASELWRGEMSDGRLVTYGTSPTSARFVLHDHPFLEHPLLRTLTAESFRHAIVLAGAKDAVAEHAGEVGQPLVVNLSWR